MSCETSSKQRRLLLLLRKSFVQIA